MLEIRHREREHEAKPVVATFLGPKMILFYNPSGEILQPKLCLYKLKTLFHNAMPGNSIIGLSNFSDQTIIGLSNFSDQTNCTPHEASQIGAGPGGSLSSGSDNTLQLKFKLKTLFHNAMPGNSIIGLSNFSDQTNCTITPHHLPPPAEPS